MIFARWLFGIAGVLGLALLMPLYFDPPSGRPLTHPQFFYGFVGSAGVMQLVYLLIARDPLRYRALMPLGALAKASFAIPCLLYWSRGLAGDDMLAAALFDGTLAILFLVAWRLTARGVGKEAPSPT